MPYVEIPKDLTTIKTKVAFNLTKRQLFCFSIAAIIGIPVYILTRKYIGNDIAVFLMIVLMLPFFFLAMYEKNGQPFEKILKNYLSLQCSSPIRVYKTQNMYGYLTTLEPDIEVTKDGSKQPKRKKPKKPVKKPAKQADTIKKKQAGTKKYESICQKNKPPKK